MSLESLQMTLRRIEEIRSRFEPQANAPGSAPAPDFDTLLQGALQEGASGIPSNIGSIIAEQAAQQGLDPDLLKAVIKNESGFNPQAVSPVGAQGLMQLMPATARGLGVTNSFDPTQNVAGGAKYLKGLLNQYQSLPKALAAYNAGPGAVNKYGGIPPYAETQNYVKKVMQSYRAYEQAGDVMGGLQ